MTNVRRLAPLLLVAGAAAFAPVAQGGTIVLLSPTAGGSPPPPLFRADAFHGIQEAVVPVPVRSRELVWVGLARDGSPARVVVTQRLVLSRVGNFSFTVPAPAEDVVAAPGSQAEPGLRQLGIVWQGFSPGRRVLAARATLEPGAAAAGLPLRVSVRRADGRIAVRLDDVATRTLLLVTGTAPSAALRGVLARLRSTLSESPGRVPTAGVFAVDGTPAGQIPTLVAAPLRVTGTITVPGRQPIGLSAVLGNGRPLTKTIFLAGRGSPRIDLRVDLLDPLELLPPPNQLTLSSLQHALGAVALSWQYRHFLASPDPVGPASASYVYRTLPRSPVAAQPQGSKDGSDTLVIVLAATLGAAALAGLVVLWAHL